MLSSPPLEASDFADFQYNILLHSLTEALVTELSLNTATSGILNPLAISFLFPTVILLAYYLELPFPPLLDSVVSLPLLSARPLPILMIAPRVKLSLARLCQCWQDPVDNSFEGAFVSSFLDIPVLNSLNCIRRRLPTSALSAIHSYPQGLRVGGEVMWLNSLSLTVWQDTQNSSILPDA